MAARTTTWVIYVRGEAASRLAEEAHIRRYHASFASADAALTEVARTCPLESAELHWRDCACIYCYKSWEQAREGNISDEIGHGGRIA